MTHVRKVGNRWHTLAEIPSTSREQPTREALVELGVDGASAVAGPFASLLDLPIFLIAADRVVSHLKRAGSPPRAILALEECVRNLEEARGDASPLFVDPILQTIIDLAGASARGARILSSDPALAIEVGVRFQHHAREEGEAFFRDAMRRIVSAARADTREFDRLLRRFRHRQMMRIALRELAEVDIRETASELADLAQASLEAALEHHAPIMEAQYGEPNPRAEQVVFGMGKLGGRELNFSSDIDVIYFYEHDEGGTRDLTMHEFQAKLFERVTRSLACITEHGFVFRVDLDLRPEGRTGPIANSLQSAERYYETWGRTWERAAWIRGRPVAGSMDLGDRVLDMMRPFVYRKSFDLKAIREILDMKTKIDLARKRDPIPPEERGVDLKLGPGGIREIEFYVQAHQLLHGGRNARLRSTNTLEALANLEVAGVVSAKTTEILANAYLLLRKVEHRVQIVDDQQTHTVPVEKEAARSIARSLGLQTIEALQQCLDRHMTLAHELFANMVGSAEESDPVRPEVELVTDPSAERELRVQTLSAIGAKHPVAALANLESAGRHAQSPFHPRADPEKRRLGQRFLSECWASPNVDRAMTHLPDLIRALVTHGSYLDLLNRPTIRRGAANILGASDLLARILIASPGLVPSVLVHDTLPEIESMQPALDTDLAATHGDVELALGILRTVKQEETLRTALADMANMLDTRSVGERLSALAERLITAALDLALFEMRERYGAPTIEGDGIAVMASGTLGAREMGYRTDLDLLVIYARDGETAGGVRAPITCAEFYTRAVQRLLTFLSMRMPQGILYPVDLRLRPSGSQGPLVVSLRNFESYHARSAELWERQSLVRARTVVGSPSFRSEVDLAIHRAAYDAGPAENAAQKIHDMRVRIGKERSAHAGQSLGRSSESRLESSSERRLDLKLGRGGLVEAQFMVQYLLIQLGRDHREIRTTSTEGALGALAQANLLASDRSGRVIQAYGRLKTVHNWLRLARDEMIDCVDLKSATLRPLALAVGYQGDNAEKTLERDLLDDTETIHECYAEVLGVVGSEDP